MYDINQNSSLVSLNVFKQLFSLFEFCFASVIIEFISGCNRKAMVFYSFFLIITSWDEKQ